jgi:hypothetical protein
MMCYKITNNLEKLKHFVHQDDIEPPKPGSKLSSMKVTQIILLHKDSVSVIQTLKRESGFSHILFSLKMII